jgi:hypothetical protein
MCKFVSGSLVHSLSITMLAMLGWFLMSSHALSAGDCSHTSISDSELRIRFGAQTSDGYCRYVAGCNDSNILCQGFDCTNPGVNAACELPGVTIANEIIYYSPLACRTTGPGSFCILGITEPVNMLCRRLWTCRCELIGVDATRCKIPDGTVPVTRCKIDDYGLYCAYQACPQ